MVEVRTKQEYLQLVPALSKTEFDELKQSIKSKKQYVPVIVNQKYEILDGHHRYKACKELGIAINYYPPMTFANVLDEKEFVIECNLKRRHLNEFQRVEMGHVLEDIESERSRQRQHATRFTSAMASAAIKKRYQAPVSADTHAKPAHTPQPMSKTRTSVEIGRRVNLSHATYARGKKIIEKGTEAQKNALRAGEIGIRKVYSQIRREEKKDELIKEARSRLKLTESLTGPQPIKTKSILDNPGVMQGCRLFNKDFRQVTLEPNSVDLIMTDPPYGQDQLYNFADLAVLATKVLKEGGSLVTYAPQYALPQIFQMMNSNMLHYWWMFIVKHSGGRQRVHKYRLWARYKPLLWFVKGPPDSPPLNMIDDVDDFIVSKPPEGNKEVLEWEQSSVEASYIIQNLSVENQVVLDPMMGTGTTGVSALRLKRQFIGIDINEINFMTAKDKIYTTNKPLVV